MTQPIVIASADVRHVEAAASAARRAGANAHVVVGAALPVATHSALARLGRSHLAVADQTYFRGPGLAKIGRRLSVVRKSRLRDSWWLRAERAFDDHVTRLLQDGRLADTSTLGRHAVFHGFGGFAAGAQMVAHDLGYRIFNDAFELHPTAERELERREVDFIGVSVPPVRAARAGIMARRLSALSSADLIVAGLPSVARSLSAHGVPEERIVVGRYGAPAWVTTQGDPSTTNRQPTPGKPLRLLYVGQIHWYKGLQRLLAAIEMGRPNEVELTICGATYPGPIAEALLARIRRLDRHSPVRMLGTVGRGELLHEFARCDAMVFPSVVGGVGLAVLEAAAFGVPLLLSEGEGIFTDGISTVETGTEPDRIREAIAWVIAHRSETVEMGHAAAKAVHSPGKTSHYADVLAQAYLNVSHSNHRKAFE